MSNGNNPRGKVEKDIRALTRDTRDLLRSTVRRVGEIEMFGEKFADRFGSLQRSVRQGSRKTRDALKEGTDATAELVHEYPYQAIGVVFGIGLLIGLFLLRRRG